MWPISHEASHPDGAGVQQTLGEEAESVMGDRSAVTAEQILFSATLHPPLRTHFPPLPDETQHQLCLAAFASPGCHWLHGLEVVSLSLCLQPGLGLGAHVCFRDKNNDIE